MHLMKNFPEVTTCFNFKDSLDVVKQYLESVSALFQFTPGGPFECGGISWEVRQPWNFCSTVFGLSLIEGLFGREVCPEKIVVYPASSGWIPCIEMTIAYTGQRVVIEVRNNVLTYWIMNKEGQLLCNGKV